MEKTNLETKSGKIWKQSGTNMEKHSGKNNSGNNLEKIGNIWSKLKKSKKNWNTCSGTNHGTMS